MINFIRLCASNVSGTYVDDELILKWFVYPYDISCLRESMEQNKLMITDLDVLEEGISPTVVQLWQLTC